MNDRNKIVFRHIVWQTNIPETVLDLYFNHVRMLPSWKLSFPNYVHPAIRDVVVLACDKTKIITEPGEYVFVFDERNCTPQKLRSAQCNNVTSTTNVSDGVFAEHNIGSGR